MTTLFISDIHISDDYLKIHSQFLDYISKIDTNINALYILGDLFDYWLGDDDPNPIFRDTEKALNRLSDKNVSVFFIHGNRDFLISDHFAQRAGIKILPDPSVIEIYGKRILISHGDIFCTDDQKYQSFRKETRNPVWQKMILEKPLEYRKEFSMNARKKSIEHTQASNEIIMDVNENEIIKILNEHNLTQVIHGHTHKPAIHNTISNKKNYQRIVLGDWYNQGSVLKWDKSGPNLIELQRTND